VRITGRPASGAGRSYLIERELDVDGYAALKTLVSEYIGQAHEIDAIPMVSSVVRLDLEPMAVDELARRSTAAGTALLVGRASAPELTPPGASAS
jgi:hypothetical protein